MFCTKCQNHVAECECGDIEERLASLAEHPNMAQERCSNCNSHHSRCECPPEDQDMEVV